MLSGQALRPAQLATGEWQREARLIQSWAKRELHGTYRQSSLRLVWTVLQPLSVYAVYLVVFHWILRVQDSSLPYLSFMVVGLTVWRYFAVSFPLASSFVDSAHVLGRVYFRREVIPLSGCLAAMIELAIGTTAMITLAWIQEIPPTIHLVALPLVYLVLILYTCATAVFLATITVFIRDVGHMMQTLSQLLFLATPVMYPVALLPSELRFLSVLNPVAVLVAMARDVALRGVWPSWPLVGAHLFVGAGCLVLAIAYLRAIEHRIVDVV